MTLKIGTITLPTSADVLFNGQPVKKIKYGQTVVWQKESGLSPVLDSAKTWALFHCDDNTGSNLGSAAINKNNWPPYPTTYKVRDGFNAYNYLSAMATANNGVAWFNLGGLTLTDTDKYSVECLVLPAINSNGGRAELVFGTGSAPDAIWRMVITRVSETTATARVANGVNDTINYESAAGQITSPDGWYHLAATYHGNGTWSFFFNGQKVGTFAYTGASTGWNFTFLHGVPSGSDMAGFDEIVLHGYERYTQNFEVQTQPYSIG